MRLPVNIGTLPGAFHVSEWHLLDIRLELACFDPFPHLLCPRSHRLGVMPEPAPNSSSPDVRSACAGREMVGPAISPICTKRTRCRAKESSRGNRFQEQFRWVSPHKIEDLPGHLSPPTSCLKASTSASSDLRIDHRVCAKLTQLLQRCRVAPGADDVLYPNNLATWITSFPQNRLRHKSKPSHLAEALPAPECEQCGQRRSRNRSAVASVDAFRNRDAMGFGQDHLFGHRAIGGPQAPQSR